MGSRILPTRADEPQTENERVTLAQLESSPDVGQNVRRAEKVFEQADDELAGWVLFPELFLTGTYHGARFKQDAVAKGFEQIGGLCKLHGIVGLIGTGWRENGKTYNQIRIVDADGRLLGVYAKTCLTYNDAEEFSPGPIRLVHTARGITFGTLICNDLWVTPGFSEGPNPHLSLKQAKAGAQVIFHAIGSGSAQQYRSYHESNLFARAAEAGCPIVAVNGFQPPAVNATSGVVGTQFAYLDHLPRDRPAVTTVTFTPTRRQTTASG